MEKIPQQRIVLNVFFYTIFTNDFTLFFIDLVKYLIYL